MFGSATIETAKTVQSITYCNTQLLLSHSLRRIIGVVGRIEQCQVAYIARESANETYRRLCHVFRTESPHQNWQSAKNRLFFFARSK
uniref:PID domain-containing protein n=1 Tax=Syphacia muris TaxID=451379 RepID=A0A0N5AV61_9BILA